MSNLNRHIKSDKAKWIITGIVFVLILAILGGVVAAVVTETNPKDWFNKPADEQKSDGENNAPIDAIITNGENVTLTISAAITAADGEYVEQVLTATVTPESVEDAGIDWMVAWADGSDSSDLSTYLTITPASDGSNVLYVRAYAAFEKDIIITATTRDGGFTATCTVKFVGNPSEMKIDLGDLTSIQDSGWGQQIYQLKTTRTYNLNIAFDNFFNQVNPSFVPEYEVSIVGVGTFDYHLTDTAGSRKNYEGVSLSDVLTYKPTYADNEIKFNIMEYLADINISGNTLVIAPKRVLDSMSVFTVPYTSSDGKNWRTQWSFLRYSDESKVPYFQIIVKEVNTGLSETLNMRIVSGVNGVSLDHSSMTF